MTARKPKGRTWESWTEQQVREAQAEGQFDELAGKGQPLPDLTGVHDPQWWVKKLMRREQLSDLPPAMAIKVKVERELAQLALLTREADVRARVAALNVEIARINRTNISGPRTSLATLDVDAIVKRWRARLVS